MNFNGMFNMNNQMIQINKFDMNQANMNMMNNQFNNNIN